MDYRQHALEIFDFQILHLQLNTPLFILALLAVVMVCLNVLLFRPVLRTMDGRQAELERLAAHTEAQQGELAALTERYRRDLDKARGEVADVRQQAHATAARAQEQVLEQARQAAEQELQASLEELKSDIKAARAQLGRAARKLAEQTAQRVLSA